MVDVPTPDPSFEALIDYLGRTRGFDFSGYKRPTLIRRVQKRLHELQLGDFTEYLDYLEVHADEYELLFNTILINVTSFFRDPKAWEYLAESVVPRIVGKADGAGIRIWSAGCASGEEAYSLAILFAEEMGDSDFRSQVKIYATDIDEHALAQARTGTYPTTSLDSLPEGVRERYFDKRGAEHSFRQDLRRSVIFGRHDLTSDAPISRLDLAVCRNTLMYFNSEAQAAIVRRLRYALKSGGHLFLGRAETLLSYGELFKPLDTSFRIFTKTSETDGYRARNTADRPEPGADDAASPRVLAAVALETIQVPHLIVDTEGAVVAINAAARQTLDLVTADIGRPFQNLEISYRPVDLRTPIEVVASERRTVELRGVERRGSDHDSRFFDVVVSPVGQPRHPLLGVAVAFLEVTDLKEMQTEVKRASEELETAYEELQSSNEELETTNEELQSTVEELETTNEELQSTNEELETTNEELRSSNEEMEALNEELRVRTDETNEANAYLASIVDGVSVGVVVVDVDFVVRTWNSAAEEMWGLRAGEVVGTRFFDIDSGLPVAEIRSQLESTQVDSSANEDEIAVDAINRRGRPVRLRIRLTPLHPGQPGGVVMLIEDAEAAQETENSG